MMLIVLDFIHRVRKSDGIKYYPQGQYVLEIRKNLRSEIQFSTSPTGSENHLSPLRFQTFNRKVF